LTKKKTTSLVIKRLKTAKQVKLNDFNTNNQKKLFSTQRKNLTATELKQKLSLQQKQVSLSHQEV
jgi:hypothetical protein